MLNRLAENIKQNRDLSKDHRSRRREIERKKTDAINVQRKLIGMEAVKQEEDETKYGRKEPNPTV